MHRTAPLLSRLLPITGQPKFVLPPAGRLETTMSAIKGLWSQLSDPSARAQYETLVESGIIKDTVLMNARNGSVLTTALFHNLQNPLFTKYQLDVADFLASAGPAILVFQDTLAKLVDQMLVERQQQNDDDKADATAKIPSPLSFVNFTGADNPWRQQARDDPTSLAARLQAMLSDSHFDDHYIGARVFCDLLAPYRKARYSNSELGEMALLSARAQEVEVEDDTTSSTSTSTSTSSDTSESKETNDTENTSQTDDDNNNKDAANASNDSSYDPPVVAASIEILFELAQTYRQPPENGNDNDDDGVATEHNLAVAHFEGYLHGKGPTRWKIAMVREAYEF